MDLSLYNKATQQLILEGERFVIERKAGALRKLESIINIGEEMNDDHLQGFAYYFTATWHYDHGNFKLFYKNLRSS